jgi:hypothetical protein
MNFDYSNKDAEYLKLHVGRMEQLADIRRLILDDGAGKGTRIAEVSNGSGLRFTVNLDRAMDIADASFKGIPLAWMSCNGINSPAYYEPEGLGWLRTWSGGLLTGCGLRNVGGPGEANGEQFGLHGRLSHIPAEDICCEKRWEGNRYVQLVKGSVRQSCVFFENLQLTRSISTVMGENSIVVEDLIENHGFSESPLMLLYHMNLGFPLISKDSTLVAAGHKVTPQNETAKAGIERWEQCEEPQTGFAEQVFYHEIPAGDDGMARIELKNPPLGIAFVLEYRVKELPYLVQWKQMGQGEYVVGLEPANCFPEGQNAMRQKGMLRHIAPGEQVATRIKISVVEL